MAKITEEYYQELLRKEYLEKITVKQLVELLNEKASEGEWISVEKQLPEIGEEYNVVWELHDGRPPVITTMEFDFKTKTWWDQITNNETKNITFWMPLPNKPV